MRGFLLFFLFIVAGGFGGLAGSVAGATLFRMPLAGGLVGGLITTPFAAVLAARFGWIDKADVRGAAIGGGLGFLAATAVAVNTLSSPVGPFLSTLLIGAGAMAGARLQVRARSRER